MLRRVILGVAAAGLFTPLWSARILGEWARAVARQGGEAGPDIALTITAWPDAQVTPAPEIEARLSLPDPADIHVLAAAIAGRAKAILTLNLRDFPARTLAREGLRPIHPDAFLNELAADHADAIHAVANRIWAEARAAGSPLSRRALFRRAGLPRLGKALECTGAQGS